MQINFIIGRDLSDEELKEVYRKAIEEDVFSTFFYHLDMTNFTEDDFVAYARGYRRIFVLVKHEERPLAFIVVDEVLPYVGHVSYYGFKEVRGTLSVDIGKAFLEYILKYCQTVIGITPEPNRIAIKFNEVIGMTKLCVIPNACYSAKEDKFHDGVLTFISR